MSFEDEFPESEPYLLAIPQTDPILEWVRENRPAFIDEPEFFRFMFQIARTVIEQAKTQLQTDMTGVLHAIDSH